ncbi:MAG: response regulator [Planctomycetota bacterium]
MPHVLIADNDPAVSSLLTEILVRSGLAVEHAGDGEQARIRARASDVAALVCDLDMPKRSGIEVLESLADLAAPPPTVVVSGYLDDAVRARLARLPFVRETLRKPFDLFVFARAVLALVRPGGSATAM